MFLIYFESTRSILIGMDFTSSFKSFCSWIYVIVQVLYICIRQWTGHNQVSKAFREVHEDNVVIAPSYDRLVIIIGINKRDGLIIIILFHKRLL